MDNKIYFPYPGLRPFKKKESKIFFGRRDQCIQLLKNLESLYFIAVTGQSGSGKSSLLKAGVIPLLKRGTMPREGKKWYTVDMTPGEDPFGNLAAALYRTFVKKSKIIKLSSNAIQSILETGPRGIVELIGRQPCIRVKNTEEQGDRKNLLLLIDQFEELFTLCQKQGFDIADRFVSLLLETAAQQKFSIFVVLTMRSDFLGHCSFFEGLPERVSRGQFLVPKLNREQIRLAIIGPRRQFDFNIQPDLMTKMLNDFASIDASFERKQDQLPLMQHVLMRMYHFIATKQEHQRELTLDLYNSDEIQGISKALNLHANDVYETLETDEKKKIAEIIFRRLTLKTPENDYVRDRATIENLTQLCIESRSNNILQNTKTDQIEMLVKEVADEFRKPENCFIYPSPDKQRILDSDSTLNITHESLIRCWNKCRQWADKEAKEAELFQEIHKRAQGSQKGDPYAAGNLLKRYLIWCNEPYHSKVWAERYYTKPAAKHQDMGQQKYIEFPKILINLITKSVNWRGNNKKNATQFEGATNFIKKSQRIRFFKRFFFISVIIISVYFGGQWTMNSGSASIRNYYIKQGDILFDKQNYIKAIENYKVTLMYSENQNAKLEVLKLIGTAFTKNGQHKDAILYYREKLGDLDTKKNEINKLILNVYKDCITHKMESAQTSTDALKKIIDELETTFSDYARAFVQKEGEDPNEEIKLRCSIHTHLARAYQRINDFEKAHANYEKAAMAQESLLEERVQLYNEWAMLLVAKNDFQKAVDRFMQARSLQPENDQNLIPAANALYESKRYDDAIQLYNRAKELNKQNPGVYSGLAFCYKKKKDIKAADQHIDKFRAYAEQSGGKNAKERIQKKMKEYDALKLD